MRLNRQEIRGCSVEEAELGSKALAFCDYSDRIIGGIASIDYFSRLVMALRDLGTGASVSNGNIAY
jgi:hypothetical protein